MAIHDDLPGVEATVCVNGQPLQEYRTDNDEVQHNDRAITLHGSLWTITNYIESQTNQDFTIKLTVKLPYVMDCGRLLYEIRVDSQLVYTSLIFPELTRAPGGWQTVILGPDSRDHYGNLVRRSMMFAKINTTTDDTPGDQILKEKARISRAGEITINFYRQERGTQLAGARNFSPIWTEPEDISKVHEKTLKGEAKSHGAAFGAPASAVERPIWSHARYIDGKDYPLAVFKFKYRSKDALKALLVIERTPEPEPEQAHGLATRYDDLTEEQQRELDAYADMMRNKGRGRNRVKNQEDEDKKDVKSIKRGRTGGSDEPIDLTEEIAKRTRLSIDLTEDD